MLRVCVFVLHIMALSYLPFIYHNFERWSSHNEEKLTNLRTAFRDLHNRTIEYVERNVTKSTIELFTHGINTDIGVFFAPDHKEDNRLKLDFKFTTRNFVQNDLTAAVRNEMIFSMRETVIRVVNRTLFSELDINNYPDNLCDRTKQLPRHQKVLTYSVFGSRQIYYEGIPLILREAAASNLYHDWRIRVYHDDGITNETKMKYAEYKNLDFCDARYLPRYGDRSDILGKLWRNIPIADNSVDVVCSRDLDSALLTREEDAVREFLVSDKFLHTMRDYPMHNAGMLAGMWCMKPPLNRPIARQYLETILERAKTYRLKSDQPLLNAVIFDTIKDKQSYVMQHDSYLCLKYKYTRPFPTQRRDNMEFVGCPNHSCNWPEMKTCPVECRPPKHILDWEYC